MKFGQFCVCFCLCLLFFIHAVKWIVLFYNCVAVYVHFEICDVYREKNINAKENSSIYILH